MMDTTAQAHYPPAPPGWLPRRPVGAVIDIIERGGPPEDKAGAVAVPKSVRINGRPVLVPAGMEVVTRALGKDHALLATMTVLALRVPPGEPVPTEWAETPWFGKLVHVTGPAEVVLGQGEETRHGNFMEVSIDGMSVHTAADHPPEFAEPDWAEGRFSISDYPIWRELPPYPHACLATLTFLARRVRYGWEADLDGPADAQPVAYYGAQVQVAGT